MAAKSGNRGEHGNTRIRFIMLEADGDAADLHQIAQAISHAVRPTVMQHAPPALPALPRNGSQQAIEHHPAEQHAIDAEASEAAFDAAPARKAPAKKRQLRSPEVLELDLTSGDVPFLAYHQEKNPTGHTKRYLVIAAWFKLHRQLDEIDIDHIYTCYRLLKQNVVEDVGSSFRAGKRQGWFRSGQQPGWYAITHVGLNEVNDLSSGGE